MFKLLFNSIFGTVKGIIDKKQKLKEIKIQNEIDISLAESKSTIKILEKKIDSDLSIDLINQQNKKFTLKDDFVTYLFLVPVFSASLVPFFTVFSEHGSFIDLNLYINKSYQSLDLLPFWYKIIVFLIIIDVLGFRNLARPIIKKLTNKYIL